MMLVPVAIASQDGKSTAMRDDLGNLCFDVKWSMRSAYTTEPTEHMPGTKTKDVLELMVESKTQSQILAMW